MTARGWAGRKVRRWAGRKVRRLINHTLHTKGRVCHLCSYPGADSADHDPPRSVLVAQGVLDPDHPRYLWPAHLQPCNLSRHDRPVTPELRAELRDKYERAHGLSPPRATLSPSLATRRPVFPADRSTPEGKPAFSPRSAPEKTEEAPP